MEILEKRVIEGVTELSAEKIKILSGILRNIFEPAIGKRHLEKLLDHVDVFLTDIIDETKRRERLILNEIDKLNREKQELKRTLKEENDDISTDNIPLYTLQMSTEESVKSLRNKLQSRRHLIETYLMDQTKLCEELDELKQPLSYDPLPSEDELIAFRNYLEAMKKEKYVRLERIAKMRNEIKQLINKLGISKEELYEENLINADDNKPTRKNIEKLNSTLECYLSQYDKMKHQIEDMHRRLTQLWKYLDVPEAHQKKFDSGVDITQATYDKLHFEMQRCEQIKKENISAVIDRVRNEIQEYWDKCLKSEAERMQLSNYTAKIFNEDVLEIYEDELRILKVFFHNNEDMFDTIKDRHELISQMDVLLNKQRDPNRYKNRGGHLLKEEKERKAIALKLSIISSKLLEMAGKFENENKKPFTVFGVRIQDIIEKDYDKVPKQGQVSNIKRARHE